MLREIDLTIGDKTYSVCFTARARFMFQQFAGYPLAELRLLKNEHTEVELPWLLCAGLEGARCRSKPKLRREPWTLDEVLDAVLCDASPKDRLHAMAKCVEAVGEAFKSDEAATSAEGKPTPS